MAFDRQAALAAGYTEAEIDAHLASQKPAAPKSFDRQAALAAGYTEAEIDAHLKGGRPEAPKPVARNEIEFELNQRARKGASVEELQAYLSTTINPTTGKSWGEQPTQGLQELVNYVRSGGKETVTLDEQFVGPDGQPVSKAGSAFRAFGDTATLNFADEANAAVQALRAAHGDEAATYDRVLAEQQQIRAADALTNPNEKLLGSLLGVAPAMLAPAGALGGVAGLGRQVAVGSALGAGTTALAGVGAQAPGQRLDNVGGDLLTGAVIGAASPVVARVGREAAQVVGIRPQSGANDALQAAKLDPAELRRRADEFQQRTGRGARLADILTPDEIAQFSRPIGASADARTRVLADAEATREALPANLTEQITVGPNMDTLEVIGPEGIVKRTVERGNQEFPAFYKEERVISPQDRVFLSQNILDGLKFDRRFTEGLQQSLETGKFTGEQLDMIRRQNDRLSRGSDPTVRETARARRQDILELMDMYFPGAKQPIANYRGGMQTAEGAELGRRAIRPGAGVVDVREELAGQTVDAAKGVALGARSGVFQEAAGGPSAAYALARRLSNSPAEQANLRAALGQQEADSLIEYALASKQAIDNVAALAKIPPEKLSTLLDNIEDISDAVVGIGAGAGGAFKANLVSRLLASADIGRGAANKLADDLMNPARREAAIAVIERAGMPRNGLREQMAGALIAVGAALPAGGRAEATALQSSPNGVGTLQVPGNPQ